MSRVDRAPAGAPRGIVSGAQSGVDRAALDAGMAAGIAVGGWCPRGRIAEDGVIPMRYPLNETPSDRYRQRTRWNVRDSSGTLVLFRHALEGGTAFTAEYAGKLGRPLLLIDLARVTGPREAADWIRAQRIEILNVAGPRESKAPGIYGQARSFLEQVLKQMGAPPGAG